VNGLADEYTVVTFDHRGTGDSPAGDEDPYTTRLFAADALRLVRELDTGPVHVLGHSMGGRVAQWMALDGADDVASLLLVSTGAGQDDGHVWRDCVPANVALGLGEFGYEQFIRNVQRTSFFTDAFAASDPDTVRWLGDAFWAGRATLANYLRHVIARQGHYTRHLLSRIALPTLVTVGSADTHRGGTGSHVEQSEYLAAHIPGARFEPIERAKHGLFWENTTAILGLTRGWLAEQAS
jgi:pimeloyl-ACP methyl ester carboxylesterase